MNNKPTFMIVGVQKAGTTTLHNYLQQHKDIFMPASKELHFFDTPTTIDNEAFSAYLSNFKAADNYLAIGESTPAYIHYPSALKRIKENFPDIKLVVLLRHPIDRMYSGYWHERKLGWEERSFIEALNRQPSDYSFDIYHRHFSYLEKSSYDKQLSKIYKIFSQEHVKIIRFEQFMVNELDIVNEVIRFLNDELSPLDSLYSVDKNVAKVPRSGLLLNLIARLKINHDRWFITMALSKLNVKRGTYPKITAAEYEYAKDRLTEMDPGIFSLYPEL